MKESLFKILLIFFIPLFAGCTSGLIYTNVTKPFVTNMDMTPVGTKLAVLSTKKIKEPFTRINVNAEWNSRAIGDAAKKAGLTTIYYADMNTFSLLGGIWKKQTIRVWGE